MATRTARHDNDHMLPTPCVRRGREPHPAQVSSIWLGARGGKPILLSRALPTIGRAALTRRLTLIRGRRRIPGPPPPPRITRPPRFVLVLAVFAVAVAVAVAVAENAPP